MAVVRVGSFETSFQETVFELRSGRYEQTAHVTGDQEYRAVIPFPVTVVPSQLVTIG